LSDRPEALDIGGAINAAMKAIADEIDIHPDLKVRGFPNLTI